METRPYHWQNEYPVDPANFDFVGETDSPWHETPEQIEDALDYGREKTRLLKWVRRHMRSKLTPRERRSIELLFFRGLTYREAGKRLGVHPSVVHRSVQRGLVRLRRQLASRRTCTRMRVSRFRGVVNDAFDEDDALY
ncbi:MAG: sigma-70 family RNA polymerase sigma factor [Candidatus Hydrogenedentota bacterium]